jgi:hypothetical protein
MGPAAYFMKSPPVQFSDTEARDMTEAFIRGDDRGLMTTAEMGNGKELEELPDQVND